MNSVTKRLSIPDFLPSSQRADYALDDWMESKIAQAEQSIVSVVKAYMYDEVVDDMKGMETLNYNDIVIGK